MRGIIDRYETELAIILIESEGLELHFNKERLPGCKTGDLIDFNIIQGTLELTCNKQATSDRKKKAQDLRQALLKRQKSNFRRE